jgi:hypothetical protein
MKEIKITKPVVQPTKKQVDFVKKSTAVITPPKKGVDK